VVARFSLFLREIAAVQGVPPPSQQGLSLGAGISLVVLGVVVNLVAAVQHWRTLRKLQRGQPMHFSAWSLGVLVALLLVLVGSIMALYLLFGLDN
jgi:putative membrane protein